MRGKHGYCEPGLDGLRCISVPVNERQRRSVCGKRAEQQERYASKK